MHVLQVYRLYCGILSMVWLPSLSATNCSLNNVSINNHLYAHNASFDNVTITNEWVQNISTTNCSNYYEYVVTTASVTSVSAVNCCCTNLSVMNTCCLNGSIVNLCSTNVSISDLYFNTGNFDGSLNSIPQAVFGYIGGLTSNAQQQINNVSSYAISVSSNLYNTNAIAISSLVELTF